MTHGFRYGPHGARYGVQGAQLAASEPQPTPSVRERGVKYGPQGIRHGVRPHGGRYLPAPASVDDIIADAGGWALIIERDDGERWVASPDRDPAHNLTSLSVAVEPSNHSDWRATVPPDPELYEFSFADVVIGHGDSGRFFHGQLLPVSGDSGGAVELGGFGPLWWATHGDIAATIHADDYSFWWQAINDVWQRVADVTESKVRGFVIRPPLDRSTPIPETENGEGHSFEGTPLAVLKSVHERAGMVFSTDHSDPANVFQSFIPATERRVADWDPVEYTVDLDPTGYRTRVVVFGAQATDAYPYERWRGVADVSDREREAVTDGRVIDYQTTDPDLGSPKACEIRARQLLAGFRAEWSITGSVDATPVRVQPGMIYRVPAFETAAPEAFHPVELPLQSAEHGFGPGEAGTALKFESQQGVVGAIRDRIQPDGVTDDIGGGDPDYDLPAMDSWGADWWGYGQWGGNMDFR